MKTFCRIAEKSVETSGRVAEKSVETFCRIAEISVETSGRVAKKNGWKLSAGLRKKVWKLSAGLRKNVETFVETALERVHSKLVPRFEFRMHTFQGSFHKCFHIFSADQRKVSTLFRQDRHRQSQPSAQAVLAGHSGFQRGVSAAAHARLLTCTSWQLEAGRCFLFICLMACKLGSKKPMEPQHNSLNLARTITSRNIYFDSRAMLSATAPLDPSNGTACTSEASKRSKNVALNHPYHCL